MIEIKGITKTYQMGENSVQALRDVSLSISDGDFVAIMGPSGSGKSTLAHILGLLDVPTSGSYKLNGKETATLSEDDLAVLRRQEMGFIFQQFNLLPRMSAAENVGLPLLYSKHELAADRPMELLKLVGLEKRSNHRPNELSGGQQQRVAIARSLINRPRMILADEPTGNLDSQSEKDIMAALKELNAQGITIVMVTHEEEIGAQAKRLIRMRDGIIQSDERREALPKAVITPQTNNETAPEAGFHWTEIFEHFRQGLKSLASNKVRTGLSMLGILIGVAAVVAMLALGKGAQQAIESQLSSLGSNLLVLRPGSVVFRGVQQEAGVTTRLTIEDGKALQEQISDIQALSGTVNGRAQVTYLNKNWNTQVAGVAPVYAEIKDSRPVLGRFFTEDEATKRLRVAVIGSTIARELFADRNPIGENIRITKVSFQVIGVLPSKGASGWRDQDDQIMVPLQTAMYRLLGKDYVENFEIQVSSAESMPRVQEQILETMHKRKRIPEAKQEGAFDIRNMADIQAALSQSTQTMTALLASIAAISLLVGGIGIMNIMLVSVTERTKEIGLRKAIGARRRDILLQFLAESVVVSAVGGLCGIALGWVITIVLNLATGWNTSISVESVALSFFFSSFIGMVFGIYPAKKASELHPIDALRYE